MLKRFYLKYIRPLVRIFWKKKDGDITPISYAEYQRLFIEKDKEKLKAAYEKAWEARKFEIDNYWKRATYFWTFLVPAFAGYFAVVNSDAYKKQDQYGHFELFVIICIGFVISVAWSLVNRGSKSWQRHWEIHVDLLEDNITGPLYKTVYPTETFSVSKINEIISWFFAIVWLLLAYKYKLDQHFKLSYSLPNMNVPVSASCIIVIFVLLSLFKGYGRGYFSNRGFNMNRRNITYKNP